MLLSLLLLQLQYVGNSHLYSLLSLWTNVQGSYTDQYNQVLQSDLICKTATEQYCVKALW